MPGDFRPPADPDIRVPAHVVDKPGEAADPRGMADDAHMQTDRRGFRAVGPDLAIEHVERIFQVVKKLAGRGDAAAGELDVIRDQGIRDNQMGSAVLEHTQ